MKLLTLSAEAPRTVMDAEGNFVAEFKDAKSAALAVEMINAHLELVAMARRSIKAVEYVASQMAEEDIPDEELDKAIRQMALDTIFLNNLSTKTRQ